MIAHSAVPCHDGTGDYTEEADKGPFLPSKMIYNHGREKEHPEQSTPGVWAHPALMLLYILGIDLDDSMYQSRKDGNRSCPIGYRRHYW